jgi:hypothetical protein
VHNPALRIWVEMSSCSFRALRGTSLTSDKGSVGHLRGGFQPPLDVQQNPSLLGVVSYRFEQQIMRDAVEKGADIKI